MTSPEKFLLAGLAKAGMLPPRADIENMLSIAKGKAERLRGYAAGNPLVALGLEQEERVIELYEVWLAAYEDSDGV